MKKIYPIGGIFLLLNILFLLFGIFPLIRGIQEKSGKLIAQDTELSLLSQRQENVENLKKVSEVYQEDLRNMEAVFVDPATPIDFIGFLEEIAASSQATIEISLGGKSIFEHSSSYHLSLESSFPNFLRFLERAENGPYPMEVSGLNIKRRGEGRISSTLTLFVLSRE